MDQLKPSPPNSRPLTPIGFLERAATVYADCTSIIYNSLSYTWSQTYCRCLKMASSIASLGSIHPGDVDSHTISILLRHAESKFVFVDYQSESLIREALSTFPSNSVRPMIVLIAENDELEKGDFNGVYEEMVSMGDKNFNWVRSKTEFDPLVLNYTSGTTSSPKGVVHSHRGAFIVSMDSLIEWSVPKEPVYLWTLPMFHANGWCYTWAMAAAGGTNVCLRRFDASVIYSSIREHGVTHMCGAPVVLNMLSNVAATKLEKPVHILTAGAPPSAAVLF